jgi:hypothetical protein
MSREMSQSSLVSENEAALGPVCPPRIGQCRMNRPFHETGVFGSCLWEEEEGKPLIPAFGMQRQRIMTSRSMI